MPHCEGKETSSSCCHLEYHFRTITSKMGINTLHPTSNCCFRFWMAPLPFLVVNLNDIFPIILRRRQGYTYYMMLPGDMLTKKGNFDFFDADCGNLGAKGMLSMAAGTGISSSLTMGTKKTPYTTNVILENIAIFVILLFCRSYIVSILFDSKSITYPSPLGSIRFAGQQSNPDGYGINRNLSNRIKHN